MVSVLENSGWKDPQACHLSIQYGIILLLSLSLQHISKVSTISLFNCKFSLFYLNTPHDSFIQAAAGGPRGLCPAHKVAPRCAGRIRQSAHHCFFSVLRCTPMVWTTVRETLKHQRHHCYHLGTCCYRRRIVRATVCVPHSYICVVMPCPWYVHTHDSSLLGSRVHVSCIPTTCVYKHVPLWN